MIGRQHNVLSFDSNIFIPSAISNIIFAPLSKKNGWNNCCQSTDIPTPNASTYSQNRSADCTLLPFLQIMSGYAYSQRSFLLLFGLCTFSIFRIGFRHRTWKGVIHDPFRKLLWLGLQYPAWRTSLSIFTRQPRLKNVWVCILRN